MRTIYLDFEFNKSKEAILNLICCVAHVYEGSNCIAKERFWLHNDKTEKTNLCDWLLRNVSETTYVSFGAEAEARSFISLGVDCPTWFSWICLHLEYRNLQNHSHELLYGKQLIDGKEKKTHVYGGKGKQNLVAVAYKLLGVTLDSERKDRMRDIILSENDDLIAQHKEEILDYCEDDVTYLPKILKAMNHLYAKRLSGNMLKDLGKHAKLRGDYAARTAKMVSLGYPVNTSWLANFSDNAPMVIQECARDINSQFPDNPIFYWNRKEQRYSLDTKRVKNWIHDNHPEGWLLTEKGQYSLALEAFESKYPYRHDYPVGNLGAQMVRYLKLNQSMKGYNPNAEKSIFDDLGSDGRVHTYLNPYGAQSSRTQPASTGFVFLKPAFQRTLVQPRKGYAIGDLDYSSEEFFLAGLMSGDKAMIEAYKSGDVYLAFGKAIGYIPKDGTKKTHKFERDICKAVVLSLSYLMTAVGLAARLTEETRKEWTEDQAQELIDLFDETYHVFAQYRRDSIQDYYDQNYAALPDGWTMWGDNEKFRSVGNFPIQGMGACIMRKAVALAQDKGLNVIFTLHDAIYIEYQYGDLAAIDTLKECMIEAFCSFFQGEMKEQAKYIRVDPQTWSEEYPEPTISDKGEVIYTIVKTPQGIEVPASSYFIDARAGKEFDKFKKYMLESSGQDLLI
jgi:hypothetical protein